MNLTGTRAEPEQNPVVPAAYALVLAAGAGSRFGGDKLLARLRGRPLIAHVASTIAEATRAGLLAGGVAVVRPSDTQLGWYLDPAGLGLITNPHPEHGLSSSLRCGLKALASPGLSPTPEAAVIILADEPLLRSEVIDALLSHWRHTRQSTRPRYANHRGAPGHPVVLDRSLWPLAWQAKGDRGLGAVLSSMPGAVGLVEVAGANPDINTPADLESIQSHQAEQE